MNGIRIISAKFHLINIDYVFFAPVIIPCLESLGDCRIGSVSFALNGASSINVDVKTLNLE